MNLKGTFCIYSGSGNTRLACEYIASKLPRVEFDLIDVVQEEDVRLEPYDVVGFATFTDFFALPRRFQTFLKELPPQEGKPAFVFNTYGSFSGKTLKILGDLAADKGFNVLAGHSLHTPESYPPLNALGITSETSPDEEELEAFNRFIDRLAAKILVVETGEEIEADGVHLGLLNRLIPALPRTTSRTLMSDLHVDAERCTECGLCEQLCPYDAIVLDPKPVFDAERCYACWACYNHCPEKAIYTKRYKDVGHYPEPNARLQQKLGS